MPLTNDLHNEKVTGQCHEVNTSYGIQQPHGDCLVNALSHATTLKLCKSYSQMLTSSRDLNGQTQLYGGPCCAGRRGRLGF